MGSRLEVDAVRVLVLWLFVVELLFLGCCFGGSGVGLVEKYSMGLTDEERERRLGRSEGLRVRTYLILTFEEDLLNCSAAVSVALAWLELISDSNPKEASVL